MWWQTPLLVSKCKPALQLLLAVAAVGATLHLLLTGTPQQPDTPGAGRHAYVFYASSDDYVCHALVNIRRLLHALHVSDHVHFVIILAQTLSPQTIRRRYAIFGEHGDRIRLLVRALPGRPQAGSDTYYTYCFLKLTVFSLYPDYDRVIYMDSDGLVLRRLDHLFTMPLEGHSCAAVWHRPWHLSSAFFVADLSAQLNHTVITAAQPDGVERIAEWLNYTNFVYDMELFNYVFDRGRKAYLLPLHYSLMDRHFVEYPGAHELALTYYVHFSLRKPFYQPAQTQALAHSQKHTRQYRALFQLFWLDKERACARR